MTDKQDQPDSDENPKGNLIRVRLVFIAASDARRRLAAAIELLLRAGAGSRDDDSQDESEDC